MAKNRWRGREKKHERERVKQVTHETPAASRLMHFLRALLNSYRLTVSNLALNDNIRLLPFLYGTLIVYPHQSGCGASSSSLRHYRATFSKDPLDPTVAYAARLYLLPRYRIIMSLKPFFKTTVWSNINNFDIWMIILIFGWSIIPGCGIRQWKSNSHYGFF